MSEAFRPMAAPAALDAFYLDARARLLDIAAALDRVARGAGAEALAADPRLERIRRALALIAELPAGRAEAVQELFSLGYDPSWERPRVGGAAPTTELLKRGGA